MAPTDPALLGHISSLCLLSCQIKVWAIPKQLLSKNLTAYRKELVGHSRRVGLVEWHPTAANILFSSGYDYKVSPGICLWRLSLQTHSFSPSHMSLSRWEWFL